jgi:PPK2 family polyphosphate:nucleotide phosphotransferase
MSIIDEVVESFRVPLDKKIQLKDFDPSWDGDDKVPEAERREKAAQILADGIEKLSAAQELLYASDSWSMLIVLQAIDAAGKDGTIKHVMTGLNPQGVSVHSFKKPSSEELDHNFLWRCMKVLPERGHIGIFNRSYYEEVLVVKVHRELIEYQRLPKGNPDKDKFWRHRYDDINNFEKHLARNGTRIVKFFLNVSKKEQKKRFLERIERPEKHWKFSAADAHERRHWDEYQHAYEDMLNETNTKHAPWYVIPADSKWITRAAVASILAKEIESLDLAYPKVTKEQQQAIEECRRMLESEK